MKINGYKVKKKRLVLDLAFFSVCPCQHQKRTADNAFNFVDKNTGRDVFSFLLSHPNSNNGPILLSI